VTDVDLARLESVLDAADVSSRIEGLLAIGVRPRQLSVRTLLVGILLAVADDRPAHLCRVHRALLALDDEDRRRLGVVVTWRTGEHLLTYRQVERTFALVCRALAREHPDGTPSTALCRVLDAICEASVPERLKKASSLAIDWTDHVSHARPATTTTSSKDDEAAWGHRTGGPAKGELFFGYYLSTATMVRDEGGARVAELTRRMVLTSCRHDPVPPLVAVLGTMAASVDINDVLCDSGYAHRRAERFALPLRRLGARLVMDLHPHDRGTRGTHLGALCHNGNLYCPATPGPLLAISPLPRGASKDDVAAHDLRCDELSRYKLGRISRDDADGYHRVMCPAVMGKLRCPLRESSMTLPLRLPEILEPPALPPVCCVQATITVPVTVNAKTAQLHDYPSKAHRVSFARRTAVERGYSTLKDPASTDTTRGWCRVMGLTAVSLLLACAIVVRNQRILDAFEERQADDVRRAAAGLEPRSRRRKRRGIDEILEAAA
jgi:hypothetical protein